MLLLAARLLGALSAYGKPGVIAFSMAMGLSLALIPGGIIIWLILFIPMMLIRINQAALMGIMAVFRLMAPLFDPLTEQLGFFMLTRPSIYAPMTRILSVPGLTWLRLDDSFVIGGSLVGIAGLPFFTLIFLILVKLYRKFLAGRIKGLFRKIGAKIPWLKKFGMAVGAARRVGVMA